MAIAERITRDQEIASGFVSSVCRFIVQTGFEFVAREPFDSPSSQILFQAYLLDAESQGDSLPRALLEKAGYLPKAN